MLNGMLSHERLLDIVENFILFDESKPGSTRKIVARNHLLLGVNQAVASVAKQEIIKREIPLTERLTHRIVELPLESRAPKRELQQSNDESVLARTDLPSFIPEGPIEIIERAHPELGRLGVFWHTQGSGKSYSMAFFAEKVRRKVPGNFTFLLMTDRHDLDSQIYKTFVGCGIADDHPSQRKKRSSLQPIFMPTSGNKPSAGHTPRRLEVVGDVWIGGPQCLKQTRDPALKQRSGQRFTAGNPHSSGP
ncbi:MAG: type restriction enzyme subunit [Acidobacteriaceae bacterium]|nr:type restriction enzyme subunit [Acidobacteriaceae bacterium]